ncbi:MAG TPA: hypothetical protein VEX60_16030 [Pyrinomonadaceae bacterium]|nr:hypothetical protein [Pyrinomonadaceae bacterium]
MNPSDYRRDYAAYHSAAERERLKRHAGLGNPSDLHEIEERYADLWTREAVADLRRAHEAAPAHFETERAGLRALIGSARIKYAEARARELTEELRSCEASSRFEWNGAKVSTDEARDLLAGERDAARRRELARCLLDKVRACDDLRAERLDAIEEATGAFGQGGGRALYESYTGIDVETLAAASVAFLGRTESRFMSQLARWAARELPTGEGSGPDYADQFFFERAASFDARFPARDFRAAYEGTLAGLGVCAASQKNLHVDDERRASKGALTACFAVEPPQDVRLVVGSRASGLDFYRRGLWEVGRAQMLAWASRDASARYPEFVYAPDAATEEGHGFLLSDLLREPAWLAGRRGVRATESDEAALFAALLDLHDARRDCARLRCALEGAGGARSEHLAAEYVSRLTGATGFRHHAATALLDADENFASATRLRARLFAAGLGEHLRSRHGRRWHESRAAGDELVDIWNTASRYSVEELARLVWGGEPDFDLLADTLLAAVEGGDGV